MSLTLFGKGTVEEASLSHQENGHTNGQGNVTARETHLSHDQQSSAVLGAVVEEKRSQAGLVPIFALASLLVAIPAVAAFLLSSVQDDVYEAQADVIHDLENAQFGDVDQVMANAKIDAERRGLGAQVAERYDLELDDFLDRRSVEIVVPETGATSTVLRFRVAAPDRRDALRQTDRWVSAYLAEQNTEDPDAEARADIETTIADLQLRRIEALGGLAQAQERKDTATFDGLTAAEYTERVSELDRNLVAAGSRYDEILRDIETQARLGDRLEPEGLQVSASLLGESFSKADPVSPTPLRNLALGLAAGLLLAATWLFVALQIRSR